MTESALKSEGMLIAASADRFHLERARRIAHTLGAQRGEVSIDDVRAMAQDLPAGNYLGSVFKDGAWAFLRYQKASHEGSHARIIAVWTYLGRVIPAQNPPSHDQGAVRPGNVGTRGSFQGDFLADKETVIEGRAYFF